MTPFEQWPHLFANGKFKVDWAGKIVSGLNAFGLTQIQEHPEMYTLIARPISDMTDKELAEYFDIEIKEVERKFCINGIKKAVITDNILSTVDLIDRDKFLYLLSIGVYPFSQHHFEDGTVINGANHDT